MDNLKTYLFTLVNIVVLVLFDAWIMLIAYDTWIIGLTGMTINYITMLGLIMFINMLIMIFKRMGSSDKIPTIKDVFGYFLVHIVGTLIILGLLKIMWILIN